MTTLEICKSIQDNCCSTSSVSNSPLDLAGLSYLSHNNLTHYQKQVYQHAYEWNVVLMDVAETPIERPKKITSVLQRQEKAPYPQNPTSGRPRDGTDSMYCL